MACSKKTNGPAMPTYSWTVEKRESAVPQRPADAHDSLGGGRSEGYACPAGKEEGKPGRRARWGKHNDESRSKKEREKVKGEGSPTIP